MHQHNCPLCDKDFDCNDLGCEEEKSQICPECFVPEPQKLESD
jgi:hypothetical protein